MFLGLVLTIISGLFFLLGIYVLKITKNHQKTSLFTTSLAFVVMLGLILFDLLPEIIEVKNIYLLIPIILGFLVFIILDKFIPHHEHKHTYKICDKVDHDLHLNHVGIITIIALFFHNMIEGITLYSVTINSSISGILMMISISLHNIPLGLQIGNSINENKKNNFLIFMLSISAFLGALIFMNFKFLNEIVISYLIALTFGILLYILIFELFNEVRKSFNKKETIYGIIVGVIILVVTFTLK